MSAIPPPNREWTPFEMQTLLGSLARGDHTLHNGLEEVTEKVNQARNGSKDWERDLKQWEVRHMLVYLFETRKALLGKGGFMDRQASGRITRTLTRMFNRGGDAYASFGTVAEWDAGRRDWAALEMQLGKWKTQILDDERDGFAPQQLPAELAIYVQTRPQNGREYEVWMENNEFRIEDGMAVRPLPEHLDWYAKGLCAVDDGVANSGMISPTASSPGVGRTSKRHTPQDSSRNSGTKHTQDLDGRNKHPKTSQLTWATYPSSQPLFSSHMNVGKKIPKQKQSGRGKIPDHRSSFQDRLTRRKVRLARYKTGAGVKKVTGTFAVSKSKDPLSSLFADNSDDDEDVGEVVTGKLGFETVDKHVLDGIEHSDYSDDGEAEMDLVSEGDDNESMGDAGGSPVDSLDSA